MHAPKRPKALLLAAQAVCAIAAPVTLALLLPLSAVPNIVIMSRLRLTDGGVWLCLLRDFALTGLLVWVEIEAFFICGRVRHASAFSVKNEKALGRIALALLLAGVITLFLGDPVVPWLLADLPAIHPTVQAFLLPFMLLTLALMVRAVQVLMRRAVTMQEETDLTI